MATKNCFKVETGRFIQCNEKVSKKGRGDLPASLNIGEEIKQNSAGASKLIQRYQFESEGRLSFLCKVFLIDAQYFFKPMRPGEIIKRILTLSEAIE